VSTVPITLDDPSIGCGGSLPSPCAESPAPTVTLWPDRLVGELKIEAMPIDPIAEYAYVSIWAQVYSNGWQDLWVVESRDAVTSAVAEGRSTAIFGASGFEPGLQYRFRVAWCKQGATEIGCNCFADATGFLDENSDYVPDPQPTLFPSAPVAAPLPTQVEDRFNRPETNPKRKRSDLTSGGANDPWYGATGDLGDGLGPSEIWGDDQGTMTGASNGSRIVAPAGSPAFAEIPDGTQMQYLPTLPYAHSYAEVQFRPHCTPEHPNPPADPNCDDPTLVPNNYRVDVRTRSIQSGGQGYSYSAQVLYEPDLDGTAEPDPKVFIRREQAQGSQSLKNDPNGSGIKVVGSKAYSAALGEGCYVDDNPTDVTTAHVAGLKDDSTKVIRIEAATLSGGLVELTAFLAWKCQSGTCANRCIWKVEDNVGDTHPLYQAEEHRLSFFVHHWDAAIEAVRGGSTQQ